MNYPLSSRLFACFALGATALAGETDHKAVPPVVPVDDGWHFTLSVPGWVPWLEGAMGIHGKTTNIHLDADVIVPRVDTVLDLRFEAQKGRLSVLGEFYYTSLSDGIGTNTVVKKLDVQMDQTIGELALAWRVIESERGYLDVVGGARYTSIYQQIALQPNDARIEEVSGELATAGTLLRARVAQALVTLAGQDPTVPIAPLAGGEAERLTAAIRRIRGNAADRQAQISRLLHDALSRTASRQDDWVDPFIGLRGRYQLNEKFYLTGKADIGGFGVGSELTWTAEAAIGMQLTPAIFAEAGYRALGIDYDADGFSMNTVMHGPQVTLGARF